MLPLLLQVKVVYTASCVDVSLIIEALSWFAVGRL